MHQREHHGKVEKLQSAIVVALVAAAAMAIGLAWIALRVHSMVYGTGGLLHTVLITAYGVLVLIYLPTRIILYILYRPFPDRGFRPSLTVVIPAYNEGPFVARTLAAVVAADYPASKKQIVVIDDGSTDGTAESVRQFMAARPGALEFVRFETNRGKRAAMAEGVRRATGEVVVFIDSDTVIDANALKYIVAPFAHPRIGGATGKVQVENRFTNFLTRMLGVRYIMSFDFYRCTASTYGGVNCLSGVISAYRRALLELIMPHWQRQTFLGTTCTFGDDRSLTNCVLKAGYNTVYCRDAVASTLAPETVSRLVRMLVRWNRSFVRESIILLRYLFDRRVIRKRKLLFFDSILTCLMPFFMLSVVTMMYVKVIQQPLYGISVVASVILMSLVYMLFYVRSEKDWQFVYGVAYAFFYISVLIWILPFATLTLKRTHWGTR